MIQESEYQKRVAEWLRESFSDIEHEPTLESGRRPDFVVHTPFESYVLEVENTFDEIYNGIGQTSVYGVETGHTPLVVVPADTVTEPLFTQLSEDPDVPEVESV